MTSRRQRRIENWSKFVDKMSAECRTVDSEIESEVKRVEDYYIDLETKLNLTKTTS